MSFPATRLSIVERSRSAPRFNRPSAARAVVAGPTSPSAVSKSSGTMAVTVGVGLVVSGLFAYLVTIGSPYLWEIVLPGSVVGMIVGFAAARYRAPISRPTA